MLAIFKLIEKRDRIHAEMVEKRDESGRAWWKDAAREMARINGQIAMVADQMNLDPADLVRMAK